MVIRGLIIVFTNVNVAFVGGVNDNIRCTINTSNYNYYNNGNKYYNIKYCFF